MMHVVYTTLFNLLFFILSSGVERRKLILLLNLFLYKQENIKVIHISY